MRLPNFLFCSPSVSRPGRNPTRQPARLFLEPLEGREVPAALPGLAASGNGHFLVERGTAPEESRAFFWQADTAWGLVRNSFREANRSANVEGGTVTQVPAIDSYFAARADQGYNVIQTSLLPNRAGSWTTPSPDGKNLYGHPAFELRSGAANWANVFDWDFSKPRVVNGINPSENNDYWDHAAYLVDTAAAHGQYTAIVAAWASSLASNHPMVTTPSVAYGYGRFLGGQFAAGRGDNIVWLIGGDYQNDGNKDGQPDNLNYAKMYNAVAEGIADGVNGVNSFNGQADYSTTFMSFHPRGDGNSSSHEPLGNGALAHTAPWLDLNMLQTGHHVVSPTWNYNKIRADWDKVPAKPTLEGEPGYEFHLTYDNDPTGTRIQAWHARRAAYWGAFAGGAGHTYGHVVLFDFIQQGQTGGAGANVGPWWESVGTGSGAEAGEAGADIGHLQSLLRSRPYLNRVPDQSVIVGSAGNGYDRLQATRASDGAYALVYTTNGRNATVNLDTLSGTTVNAWWYDPRTGAATAVGAFPSSGQRTFDPPGGPSSSTSTGGNDWVLVLDDAARGFGTPGVIAPPPTQTPYGGTAWAVPGTIQAENFDIGGEGVAYHDADPANNGGAYRTTGVDLQAAVDAGGGQNVGWVRAGEWLEYTIGVTAAGIYQLAARVANPAAGGKFHLEVDGVNVTGSLSVPNTGNWQTWQTVTKEGVFLTAGRHVLRVALDAAASNGYVANLNWVRFTATQPPASSPAFPSLVMVNAATGVSDEMSGLFSIQDDSARAAVGDVNDDGKTALIFGGGPRIRIADTVHVFGNGSYGTLDNLASAQLSSFLVGDPPSRGGARVVARTVDGDAFADLVLGSGDGRQSEVRMCLKSKLKTTDGSNSNQAFDPFGEVLIRGVFVG